MSCDGNRAKLFSALAARFFPLVGGPKEAVAFLDTIYDVVASQPASERKIDQLAAAAATRRMMALAKNGANIDLYPHPSTTGLPNPDAQAAWKAISDVMDAVEEGTALPALAVDAQQYAAFGGVTAAPMGAWNMTVSTQTRQRLRQLWADDPEQVKMLIFGVPIQAAYISEMTRLLADDPKAPPHLAAAARYALALDEQDALDGEARIRWVQALGAVAGVGIGPSGNGRCAECGAIHRRNQKACDPEHITYLADTAAAVAEVLADPEHALTDSDASPYEMVEQLLRPWMTTRTPATLTGEMGRLLAVAQVRDATRIQHLGDALVAGHRQVVYSIDEITAATLRRPILFDGVPHVWERGGLQPQATWMMLEEERRNNRERPQEEIDRLTMNNAHIYPDEMLLLLAGKPVPPGAVSFGPQEKLRRFGRKHVPIQDVKENQLVEFHPCQCVYRCGTVPSRGAQGYLERQSGGTCSEHPYSITYGPKHKELWKQSVFVVDVTKPGFALPTWPPLVPGGV